MCFAGQPTRAARHHQIPVRRPARQFCRAHAAGLLRTCSCTRASSQRPFACTSTPLVCPHTRLATAPHGHVGKSFLSAGQHRQMCGRAGRAGFASDKGESFLLCTANQLARVKDEIVHASIGRCTSQLELSGGGQLKRMALALVVNGHGQDRAVSQLHAPAACATRRLCRRCRSPFIDDAPWRSRRGMGLDQAPPS